MNSNFASKTRRIIRMGQVGGGPLSWIGGAHRKAAFLDGSIELVAGCFSSDPTNNALQGASLHLSPNRVYVNHKEFITREKNLPPEERVEFIVIVLPDQLHFEVSKDFILAGFHVLCDKPVTFSFAEAVELGKIIRSSSSLLFGVTHNYTGYPLIKHARQMISSGLLGSLRKVHVEYLQGWLTSSNKQDISVLRAVGTHAYHLVSYLTNLRLVSLCADVSTYVEGRTTDDDSNILLRWEGGVKGVMVASQVCTGEVNGLRIKVFGTEGSISWAQEEPNYLYVRKRDAPVQILERGMAYLSDEAIYNSRVPPGHPEGYLEGFANIYANFAASVEKISRGEKPNKFDLDFPQIEAAAETLYFLEKVLESSKEGNPKWIEASFPPF